MKAKPKSFALAKFQQAGQLAIAKNKAAKVAFLSPFPVVWGGGSRCLSFVYEGKVLPCFDLRQSFEQG